MKYTTDNLLSEFKRQANIPSYDKTYSDSELLNIINSELLSEVMVFILSLTENYFVETYETPVVNGQSNYRLPDRAMGQKVKDVFLKDSTGQKYPLDLINEEDIPYFNTSYTDSDPRYCYLENNDVVLYKTPSQSVKTLVIKYFKAPSEIVASTRYAKITDVNEGTKTITFASKPSVFTDDDEYDIVKNKNGYENEKMDLTVASSTSTTITFNESISGVAVNDWVCLAKESPIAQLPNEAHELLIFCAAVRFMEGQENSEGLEIALRKKQSLEKRLETLFNNRITNKRNKLRSSHGRWW